MLFVSALKLEKICWMHSIIDIIKIFVLLLEYTNHFFDNEVLCQAKNAMH